jgi:hypothetical protein
LDAYIANNGNSSLINSLKKIPLTNLHEATHSTINTAQSTQHNQHSTINTAKSTFKHSSQSLHEKFQPTRHT